MKKRLAIFTHGGVGGGLFSQGVPHIVEMVEGLALEYELTIFSVSSFNKDFQPNGYKATAIAKWIKPNIVRWFFLVAIFLARFIVNRYQILFAYWGHPAGTVVVKLGKVLRVKSIVTILGSETANLPGINYGMLRDKKLKERIISTCENTDELICLTHHQVNRLKAAGLKREPWIVPFGIDPNKFRPLFRKLELPLKIIHVANLNEVKDQETLLKAFQIVQKKIPSSLRIVGGDYLNGHLQKLTQQMSLQNVDFVGVVRHTDLLPHLQWADAFMLTSFSEGQNVAITEAMMCGLLPISTNVGIMDDIGRQVGIVAECGDYVSLANQVVELYSKEEEWNRKRRAAYDWACAHDFNWSLNQVKKVIER